MLFVLLFSRRVASHSCETLRELLHDQTNKRGVQQVNGNWRGTNCNSSTLFARIKIFYPSVADYSFRQIKSLPLQQFFFKFNKADSLGTSAGYTLDRCFLVTSFSRPVSKHGLVWRFGTSAADISSLWFPLAVPLICLIYQNVTKTDPYISTRPNLQGHMRRLRPGISKQV